MDELEKAHLKIIALEDKCDKLIRDAAEAWKETRMCRAAIDELVIARAAWIHHVNAPKILHALSKIGIS